MLKKEEQLQKISEEIEKIIKKENKISFFIVDTKGNPSGYLQYIYRMAKSLKDSGYNVQMVHQDKEFIGPFEWLGEEFKELPHYNAETENVEVSPSDILIIPEIYSNAFAQLKTLPCKKVVLFQDFDKLTEFMPLSVSLEDMNIYDAITTSEEQKKYILDCFPFLNVHIVEPMVSPMFRPSNEPQNLVVNIISKRQEDINKIIKPFYWKYPVYKWVSFKDLRGMTQEQFSESLRTGAITIWIDEDTSFGYSAVEALKCGTILLGKIPQNPVSWMFEKDNNLTNDVLWFDNIRDIPEMLSSIVRSWTLDSIPEDVYYGAKNLENKFTQESFDKNVKSVIVDGIIETRKKDFEEALTIINSNNDDKTENE